MKRRLMLLAAISMLALHSLNAQEPAVPQGDASTPAGSAPLGTAQLDQLTAPIALYSDPLLGQVLTAATYPLEVVEAARWLDDPANAALRGDALTAALQQQNWDLSVKSLVPFPDVLRMMNDNLQWTEQLGDAFLAQQAAVMDSVQRLRQRAAAAGSLQSTPQQTVTNTDQEISIEPTDQAVVYVPYYVPQDVYGPWPWPDYPPFYFGVPAYVAFDGALIGFGIGFGILGPYWGWDRWDWHHHRLDVYPHGSSMHPWQHDPVHRRGVPYQDAGTAARYQGENAQARRAYRGFPPAEATRPAETGRAEAVGHAAPVERAAPVEHAAAPVERAVPVEHAAPPVERAAPVERVTPPSMVHPTAPAFESYGSGSEARSEAARGYSSRSEPAPRSAPSSRAGGSRPRGGA